MLIPHLSHTSASMPHRYHTYPLLCLSLLQEDPKGGLVDWVHYACRECMSTHPVTSTPILYVSPISNVPFMLMPMFLGGNSTPTIPQQLHHLESWNQQIPTPLCRWFQRVRQEGNLQLGFKGCSIYKLNWWTLAMRVWAEWALLVPNLWVSCLWLKQRSCQSLWWRTQLGVSIPRWARRAIHPSEPGQCWYESCLIV